MPSVGRMKESFLRGHTLYKRDADAHSLESSLIRIVFILFVALLLPPVVHAQDMNIPTGAHSAPPSGLGFVNTPEDFDRLLHALGSTDTGQRDEALGVLDQMGDIAIPALIQLGLWNPDDRLRQNAISALAKMGPAARDPLLKALRDKEARVRAGAAQALRILADPTTVSPLIRTLGDKVAGVRQEAFAAVATFGPLAVSDLIKALVDPHPDIRRNTAVLLQKMGRPAVPPLIRTLKHTNSKMRATAASILGQIGDTSAIPYLVPMMGDSQSAVREEAITALARFQARAVQPLMTILKGSDTALHEPAFSVLTGIGKPAIPALSGFIQNSSIPYPLRAKAGRLLDSLGWSPKNISERIWSNIVTERWDHVPPVPQALSPLMITMGDPSENIRKSASKAIVPLGAKAVTALATEILRRREPLFLEAAAETLGIINIRDFLAVEALTGLLQNRSDAVQSAVIKTLGQVGNYIAVEPLLKVVEDGRRPLPIRILAVESLEKLGDPRIVPRLLGVLERTRNISFQKGLIDVLGQLRSAEAAPTLIKRLGDESPEIQKVSGEALIKLRPLPIASLIDLLADPRPIVQKQSASLLATIGEPAVSQLVATLKERDISPNLKAQAELLLIKVLEALPGNADVLIKALDAPSDRVRLLAIQSLSEIKTIRAVPNLLDISEQEWRYPAHLREQAKMALEKIKGNADSKQWEEILEQRRLAYFKKLALFGQIGLRILYAVLGYWGIMSILGIALSKIVSRNPSYSKYLAQQVVHKKDTPLSRASVQRGLRAGFSNMGMGMLAGLLLTVVCMALLVWGRILNSMAWTFYIGSGFFVLGCWLQSTHGVAQISRFLDYRKNIGRLFVAPLTYLGILLFPMTTESAGREELSKETVSVPIEPVADPTLSEEPLTSFAMLLSSFSRSERIDILQGLGEHAAHFPPTDPHEVLDFLFKETYERARIYKDSKSQEDIRAFLKTLIPMAMALSHKMEEIPETLSKMIALVGTSNSLVKLESFFSEVLSAVEHTVLKGSFPILLELLQAGFFPTTELMSEAKASLDRPLLYYAWREIVTTKIQKDQFNLSDAMHIALHYTSFRQRAQQSRILNMIGYTSHYADYKKIVDEWKKGSQKNAERVRHLREIADQFGRFIEHMDGRNRVLASPWLTRRLEETFGSNGHTANWLFVVSKSGVGLAPSFQTLDSKIPESKISASPSGTLPESQEAEVKASVDAFDTLMSQ